MLRETSSRWVADSFEREPMQPEIRSKVADALGALEQPTPIRDAITGDLIRD
jgi:hypothetical protein